MITRQEISKEILSFSIVVVCLGILFENFIHELENSTENSTLFQDFRQFHIISGNSLFSIFLYLRFCAADTTLHSQKVANLASDFFSHISTFNVGHCNKRVVIITAYWRPSCSQIAVHFPREIVEPPFWKIYKSWLDVGLNNLLQMAQLEQRGWTGGPTAASSSLNLSVILWY